MANSRKPRSAEHRSGAAATEPDTPSDPAATSACRAVTHALHTAFQHLPAALTSAADKAPIAIAFSGGLDSSVLLTAAVQAFGPARCLAFHIHHGLSPHADSWLAACERRAATLGVRFAATRVALATVPGDSLEATARTARYTALSALCEAHGAPILLLGHHADDQAETVLLQLLRGGGLPGIAAMPLVDMMGSLARVRPFLALPRTTLSVAAHAWRLEWVDDESNQDPRFTRNALRHQVLPAIAQLFPGYRDALMRAAAHAADAQTLADALAAQDLQTTAAEPVAGHAIPQALARDELARLPAARIANLLRYWTRSLGMPAPSRARLAQMARQALTARDDAQVRIQHAGHVLRVYRGRIFWQPDDGLAASSSSAADSLEIDAAARMSLPMAAPVSEPSSAVFHYRGQAEWLLPQWGGALVFESVAAGAADALPLPLLSAAPLSARPRQGGERLRRTPTAPNRTLKNLFQEAGVPAWQRQVPLIYLGERLLFVPYLGLAHEKSEATPNPVAGSAACVRLSWRPRAF